MRIFIKQKPEQKISLEALGHFFIQYTSQEQDREFYRQVVNMIDPERDLDAPKRFGQNDLKPENSGENNSEEKWKEWVIPNGYELFLIVRGQ